MPTITLQINHSQLDAAESGGTVDVTGGALNANAATHYIGFIFSDNALEGLKGATITSAYLDFYFTSGSFDDPDVTIYGHDSDYTASFLGTTNEISGWTPTSATVGWSAGFLGTGWKTSPDIKTVIQEIVDRPGWPNPPYPEWADTRGVIIKGHSSGSFRRVRSYEGDATQAAKLKINYDPAPAAGQPMAARGRQVPGMRRPHGSQGW